MRATSFALPLYLALLMLSALAVTGSCAAAGSLRPASSVAASDLASAPECAILLSLDRELVWRSHTASGPELECQSPPRTSFVFHVYVDPIHGDDAAAYRMNPRPNASPNWATEYQTTPLDPTDLNFNKSIGPLQHHPAASGSDVLGNVIHAPYPFKTIDGGAVPLVVPEGALQYIQDRVIGTGLMLPKNIQVGQETLELSHVIVHCLPGLYGPIEVPGQSNSDAASGLTFNGEHFPVRMLHRVSLQGTSALDTILDARGVRDAGDATIGRNAIVSFVNPFPPTTGVELFGETFIDSLTIRNNTALDQDDENHFGDGSGAGVYVGGEGACLPLIGNCFIVRNQVGIGIESDTNRGEAPHRPRIVHNTIARNGGFQIWSGDRTPLSPGNDNINYGRAQPLIYNNIFDAPGGAGKTSFPPTYPLSFAGIHWDDMIVTESTLSGVVTAMVQEFNAYQDGSAWEEIITVANVLGYIIPLPGGTVTWPLPAIMPPSSITIVVGGAPATAKPRTGSTPRTTAGLPTPFIPREDLTMSGRQGGSLVGTLFIADLFRNYIDATQPPRSQHDFRLAPMVRGPAAGASAVNPLVGKAINLSLDGTANAAGIVVADFSFGQPGYTPARRMIATPQGLARDAWDYPSATHHEWDEDAEGFANPRIARHPSIPVTEPYGDGDLGADEVDMLVVSGYLDGTRIFARDHMIGATNILFTLQCVNPYYFGVGGTTFQRPNFTWYTGLAQEWYGHIGYPGTTPADRNWTRDQLMPVARWTDYSPAFGGLSTMRNEAVKGSVLNNPGGPRSQLCDFGTLLLPDPKPWGWTMLSSWLPAPSAPGTAGRDLYGSFPWYNNIQVLTSPAEGLARRDNQNAYWYPFDPLLAPPQAQNAWGIEYSQPFTGMVNPPGTMVNDVSLTGQTPPGWVPAQWVGSHLWLLSPFTGHLLADTRYGHFKNSLASNTFDAWGVGDSGQGGTTVDEVQHDFNPWRGMRVNLEAWRTANPNEGRTNLQTFLSVNEHFIEQLQSGPGPQQLAEPFPVLPWAVPGEAAAKIQAYMTSETLQQALKARRQQIEAFEAAKKGGK